LYDEKCSKEKREGTVIDVIHGLPIFSFSPSVREIKWTDERRQRSFLMQEEKLF